MMVNDALKSVRNSRALSLFVVMSETLVLCRCLSVICHDNSRKMSRHFLLGALPSRRALLVSILWHRSKDSTKYASGEIWDMFGHITTFGGMANSPQEFKIATPNQG